MSSHMSVDHQKIVDVNMANESAFGKSSMVTYAKV
jgi:hypothetical protein